MAIKYFKLRTVGSILAVNDKVMVGEGENAKPLIDQYEKRPEYYIPCDKDGNALKAEKTEKPKKEEAKAEAEPKAEKAEKE